MNLTRKSTGHHAAGICIEETETSWRLKPVEYITAGDKPMMAFNPEGLWFRKVTWEKI